MSLADESQGGRGGGGAAWSLSASDGGAASMAMKMYYALRTIGGIICAFVFLAAAAAALARFVVPFALSRMRVFAPLEMCAAALTTYGFIGAMGTESLGMSMELGAFLAGMTISGVKGAAKQRLDRTMTPIREFFSCVFFASMGLSVDFVFLYDNIKLVVVVCSCGTLIKFASIFTPLVASDRMAVARAAGLAAALSHFGEFAFVLVENGRHMGVLSTKVHHLLMGVVTASMIFAPFALRFVFSCAALNRVASSEPPLQKMETSSAVHP
eukprot:GHVU01211558.1.p1 GENE.GHVU01211558.1~~GHVU01211558.1.p1  ORF type:complete len:269 (-),score=56.64 GHVU01211558.1:1119-1925(-)